MNRHNSHSAVITVVLGLITGACDGIWDLQRVGPPPVPDGPPPPDAPPPDGAGELGFNNRKLIAELSSTSNDGEPSITADATELYFKSTRPGGEGMTDIWRSTRATTSAPWSTPTPVAELSTGDNETSPRVSPDGLTIWIQRNNAASVSMTMVSNRATRGAAWSTPVQLTEFDAVMGDNQFSSTTPDQRVGYLTSKRGTTTRAHLFRSTRTGTGPWETPVEVPELLSTMGYNQNAWPSPDDLSIMWSSDRGGSLGQGDLWLATRATTTDPFGTPINLGELNNEFFQADPWATPDLRYIVFASNETGNLEIFEASR